MRLLAASILVFAFYATAASQDIEHAPALQSCAADVNLWTAQIPGWPGPGVEQLRDGTKTLTVKEMQERISYLGSCGSAYPVLVRAKSGELPALVSLMTDYSEEIEQRLHSFLVRHGLEGKFMLEDEAGKR